jgi:hypothetical protein
MSCAARSRPAEHNDDHAGNGGENRRDVFLKRVRRFHSGIQSALNRGLQAIGSASSPRQRVASPVRLFGLVANDLRQLPIGPEGDPDNQASEGTTGSRFRGWPKRSPAAHARIVGRFAS